MSGINSTTLRTKLWEIGGDDPRYQNFLKAAGIQQYVSEKKAKYDKLLWLHKDRINRYRLYYQLFIGHHWLNVSDENINPLKVNYCWYNINKNSAFLMNKGFLVESDFPEIERFLQNNWKMNLGGDPINNKFGLELSIFGGTFGDEWVSLFFDKHEYTGASYIKYDLLNPLRAYPVVDNNKMVGYLDYGQDNYLSKLNDGFAEYEEKTAGWFYAPGIRKRIVDEEVLYTEKYDFLDIPIVHFKNFPTMHSFYGMSDLTQISDLNMNFDNILTELDEIVKYHASPVTILKGAKSSELIRGANKVWAIPAGAEVANLELSGDLTTAGNHLARLREGIAEVSNVPQNKLDHISNTSAAALAITFMPLYETMEMKRMFYGTPILRMNAMTLKLAFLSGKLKPSEIITRAVKRWEQEFKNADPLTKEMNKPFEDDVSQPTRFDKLSAIYNDQLPKELYETYLTWFPPLPRDEKTTADMALAMVNGKLWSRRHARSVMNMAEKESRLMEKELEEEFKAGFVEKMDQMTMTNASRFNRDPNQVKTGMEGDKDVKGDKESRRIEKGQKKK